MGVSGGGGDPLVALVVEVEAVEANLFISFLGVGDRIDGAPLEDVGLGIGGG